MSDGSLREKRASVATVAITLLVIAIGASVGDGAAASARPFVPDDDSDVVAHVPARASDPTARELTRLGRALAQEPRDLAAATRLARMSIEEARRRSDPRLLGRAQAALGPWWKQDDAPPEVLLLRATILQSRHDFDGALADLDRLLRRAPDDVQALLTRAVVLTVRGRYEEARASCRTLAPLVSRFVATMCRAPIDAASGRGREAAAALAAVLNEAPPQERAWGHSLLGELLYWAGDRAAAEPHLAWALAAEPDDGYTRALYADLLLDSGRPGEAARLVAGHEQEDGLLLRLALAEAAQGAPRTRGLMAELEQRFAAARLRGDAVHQREEARYALALAGDPRRALTLAQANWQVQREPWDARLLREATAAVAALEGGAP